ncbi:MAG: hypothetical protein E7357_06495 [Clostridiales bacterium]|nr:hypothetical protein [Clostridiales bacterium]
MKKLKKFLLTLTLAACVAFAFTGCKDDEPEEETPSTSQELTLNYDNYRLDIFQSVTLKLEGEYDGTPTWISDNPTVISVENGVVTALAEGSAVITVKIGDTTLTCNVTVSETSDVPMLVFDGIEEVSVMKGDTYELTPYVLYKGVKYDDAEFTYTVADTQIATVNGATLTANKVGETTLYVSANWRSFVDSDYLKTSLPLKVNEDVLAKIDTESATLYMVQDDLVKYGKTYSNHAQLQATVLKDGAAVNAENIVWRSSDESVLTVDADGVATAVSIGTAEITVAYENGDSVCTSMPLTVSVEKPLVDITRFKPLLVDCFLGNDLIGADDDKITYDFSEMTDGRAVTSITNVATGETVAYNAQTKAFTDLEIGEGQWLIDNELFTVKANVICATKVISTAQEFLNLQKYGNLTTKVYTYTYKNEEEVVKAKNYEGYFVLANNINLTWSDYGEARYLQMEYVAIGVDDNFFKQITEVGFSGTFNGLGYAIDGIIAGEGGMFGNISAAGTVKNLVVRNARIQKITWRTTGVIANGICGTLDNVTVDVDFENLSYDTDKSRTAALAYHLHNATLKNVYVSARNVSVGHPVLAYWATGKANRVIDCTVSTKSNPLVAAGSTTPFETFALAGVKEPDVEQDVTVEDGAWE